jgi:phosphoglycolate phosphatase-like HAD superfamily hydrolase
MAKVLLFDIDQTLLYTGGAGTKAMNLAFEELFGIANGLAKVEFAGRTDVAIFRDVLRFHGIDGDFSSLLDRFQQVYVRHLERMLPESQGSLLPGVQPLLEALSRREDVLLGLTTGNFRSSGERKLRYYGIHHYFRDGGFADDSEDRAEIVRIAARRVAGARRGPHQLVVIGDTPHDIASAKANGALALAVATGKYSLEDLDRAGADMVVPDLSDWQGVTASLLGEG